MQGEMCTPYTLTWNMGGLIRANRFLGQALDTCLKNLDLECILLTSGRRDKAMESLVKK